MKKEVKVLTKYLRISPRRLRMRAKAVSSLTVQNALTFLQYENSKAANFLFESLKSAAANATNNFNLEFESLLVKNIQINGGPTLKRIQPRARGRADRITKPTSHILVVIEGETLSGEVEKRLDKKPESKKVKKLVSDEKKSVKAPKKIGKEAASQGNKILNVRKEEM